MTKTVIMLIGPKGSGKTHIGTVLEKLNGVIFLRVEPIWLQLLAGEDGWAVVENAVDGSLVESDVVVIESLGGSAGFEGLRQNLEDKYCIKYVRVVAPLDVCAERVRSRDSKDHIPVSDDKVDEYNRVAASVSLPWDLELANDPPLSDDAILESIQRIQQDDPADGLTAATDL